MRIILQTEQMLKGVIMGRCYAGDIKGGLGFIFKPVMCSFLRQLKPKKMLEYWIENKAKNNVEKLAQKCLNKCNK